MLIYKKLYYVYFIPKHPKTNQPYVGCTTDLKRRMYGHKVSIDDVEILWETDDIKDASLMEQDLQKRLCGQADKQVYHLHMTEETKLKISEANTGKTRSSEHCQAISEANTGKTRSPEHCQAISDRQKGHVVSIETRQAISSGMKGKKLSPRTPEYCQAISNRQKGKKRPPRTPEHCQKQSDAMKAYWVKRRAEKLAA